MDYYNENDPYCAAWLRNLIGAGHLPIGIVDERDIRDIEPDQLTRYRRCHFFAGIGIWALALEECKWPDHLPVWTGSCPCQPFSAAGARKGTADERHLWPHWAWLIEQQEQRPTVVLGEQVASKDGRAWFDLVSSDLERLGYAAGAADLCAPGFGGAHIRQRLYFVGVADSEYDGRRSNQPRRESDRGAVNGRASTTLRLADRTGGEPERREFRFQPEDTGILRQRDGGIGREPRAGLGTHAPMLGRHLADWLFCRDGKWRPVRPGSFPLALAPASPVGRLRAYGNALDLETAKGFTRSVLELLDEGLWRVDI